MHDHWFLFTMLPLIADYPTSLLYDIQYTPNTQRSKSDILFIFRILNGYIDSIQLLSMIIFYICVELFNILYRRTNIEFNTPMVRSQRICNLYSNKINLYNVSLSKIKIEVKNIFNS